MSTKKATKRALLTSILAICLCLVMLIGSTFAWFTDTASTGVNTITSGNLDVQIQDEQGKEIDALAWKTQDGTAFAEDGKTPLWEPGCTYTLTPFVVKNVGNLALKYKLAITGIEGDTGLLKVIKFTVKMAGTEGTETTVDLSDFEDYLKATEASAVITVSAHMDEAAGNDYMNKTLEGVKIEVYATQDTVEYDSTRNDYDANAGYPVANAGELKTALTTGGAVSVKNEIKTSGEDTLDARMIISQPTTLNLDAKIVSPDNMGDNDNNFVALVVDADTTINASANGGIDTGTNGGYGINVRNGATLTINGGNYYGGGTTVQVQKGTLIINDGFFACEPYSDPTYGSEYLINCIDSAYKDGTAKITVKGGTFVNFNPANCKAEGAGTNFVADGYKVISETQSNGEVWYTVVPE